MLMSEGLKIAITAAAGIGVFVIGQIIQKSVVEPIQEQRKLAGEVLNAIVFYANLPIYSASFSEVAAKMFHSVAAKMFHSKEISAREEKLLNEIYEGFKTRTEEGSLKLRSLSSQIYQSIQVIPCYWLFETLRIVRKRKDLYEIATHLVRLANTSDLQTAVTCQNAIIVLLKARYLIGVAAARNAEMDD